MSIVPDGNSASSRRATTSWRRCAVLAAGLALLLLGVSVAPSIRPFLFKTVQSNTLRTVLDQSALVPPLIADVGLFALAVLVLHLALAALAVLLTAASESIGLTRAASRGGACFLWLTALASGAVLTSALEFPNSHGGGYYGDVAGVPLFGVPIGRIWALLAATAALLVLAAAGVRMQRRWRLPGKPWRLAAALIAVTGIGLLVAGRPTAQAAAGTTRPHIVIIGIDSLRADHARSMTASGELPHLAGLLSRSAWFADTTTPLARTFPSWISILTGRTPEDAGVVCNLIPQTRVHARPTLADWLSAVGYHTVFATDEVRFSNIDETYGFDKLLTPDIGAADFLLGEFADIPLVNLFGNTPLAAWIFPQLYTNRAVSYLYRPESFVERLHRNVRFDRPTLLAAHLTTPHWPYVTADSRPVEKHGRPWDSWYGDYRNSLHVADGQLGGLLAWLEAEGVLDNAVVVLLSDHGEAMFRDGDSLIENAADEAVRDMRTGSWGHGSSVLSPAQFQVVLAFSAFGQAAGRVAAGMRDTPASLEDVAPTLLDLLAVPPATHLDGLSLAPAVQSADGLSGLADRVRFTETGFNTPRMLAGDVHPKLAAMKGASHYRINRDNAYVELRPESFDIVREFKERAVIQGPWLLAALPGGDSGVQYVLARRDGSETRQVESLADHPALEELWRAMSARFGPAVGELGGRRVPTPGDAG